MEVRYAYEGILNGIKGVWGDTHPEDVVVEKVVMFITASNSEKELQNKKTKKRSLSVVIKNENEMNDWEEVKREKFHFQKEIRNG